MLWNLWRKTILMRDFPFSRTTFSETVPFIFKIYMYVNPWPRTIPLCKNTSALMLRLSQNRRPTNGCRARSTSLWVHRNLLWQLSRDGNLNGLSMSHTMTASPKPSFRAPWRVGDAVVSRRNAGWTTSKSGHTCPCLNCSQGPPAEKTGRGSLLNRPSCPPNVPVNQGTELN